MELLRLSIRQNFARLGIETQPGELNIRQQKGEQIIHQNPAEMSIENGRGELLIDASDAYSALGVGPHLEWNSRIYSQMYNIALQSIAGIVEDGNRMAQITNSRNAFADIAKQKATQRPVISYTTEASVLNVKMEYIHHPAQIEITPQKAEIEYIPQKAEINYNRGNTNIYLKQKNSIDIQVSQYDWYR